MGKKDISHKIQTYFRDQMDQDISSFEAELLLNFFTKEIGCYYCNQGLLDAQATLQNRLDDIDAFYVTEKSQKAAR